DYVALLLFIHNGGGPPRVSGLALLPRTEKRWGASSLSYLRLVGEMCREKGLRAPLPQGSRSNEKRWQETEFAKLPRSKCVKRDQWRMSLSARSFPCIIPHVSRCSPARSSPYGSSLRLNWLRSRQPRGRFRRTRSPFSRRTFAPCWFGSATPAT